MRPRRRLNLAFKGKTLVNCEPDNLSYKYTLNYRPLLSREIYSIISGCYSFSNTEDPILKKIIDMIYYNNYLATQLLNHLTRSGIIDIIKEN